MLWALEARTLYSNFWNLTLSPSLLRNELLKLSLLWTFHIHKGIAFSWQAFSPLSWTGSHFSEESPTIGTNWTRTHNTHKKLLEETWDWLWSGHNSNANAFHQWFALGAKFWGKRRTKTTDHLLFSTNQQNASNTTNILFSNQCYREVCRKHCNAQSIIIGRHYQWYPY